MILTSLAWFGAAAAAFCLLRFYPIWPVRFQGCDAYYILMCAESFRRDWRLPIRLPPLYILEKPEQWYPPGFFIVCALIPQQWLQRYYWALNHIIDLATIGIGFAICASAGLPAMGALAVVVYALAPGLVLEYANLTIRPFGALLLTGFLLLAFYGMADWRYAIAAALVGISLLFSHKLSSQQLWFTAPILTLTTADWRWLIWPFVLYLLALALWPRGFWRIVRAHAIIIRFWHRHWPLLGAHAVRQSPIYGDGKTRIQFYGEDTWSSALRFCKDMLHQNYFVLPLIGFVVLQRPSAPIDLFLLGWIISVYLAATFVHFVHLLRGIGLGRQYLKFAMVPTLVFLALHVLEFDLFLAAILIAAVALEARQYIIIAHNLRREETGQVGRNSTELRSLVDLLNSGIARVMCLPAHLCDLVAYSGRFATYWGTHSEDFDDRLAAFFPVLRRRVEDYAAEEGLTHLLIDQRYVTAAELRLPSESLVKEAGSYALFDLTHSEQSIGRHYEKRYA
jgi:hypothetical protein